MRLSHSNHYENMLFYGECDCGMNSDSVMTIGDLVRKLEQRKMEKLLQEYPDIRLGKKVEHYQTNPY